MTITRGPRLDTLPPPVPAVSAKVSEKTCLPAPPPVPSLAGPPPMPAAPALLEQEWVTPESPAVLEHEPLFPPPEELWSGVPAFDWGA